MYRKTVMNAVENHHFWVEVGSSGFYVPVFSVATIAIPDRCQMFTAYGTLLALHCYVLGQGPLPVSIWLLLVLIVGEEGMLIPKEVLAALDPVAFDTLAPWLTMTPSDPIPTHFAHPLSQFLVNVVDVQVSHPLPP